MLTDTIPMMDTHAVELVNASGSIECFGAERTVDGQTVEMIAEQGGVLSFAIKSLEDYPSLLPSFLLTDNRSVVNLSDMVSREAHISLLSRGLNLILIPRVATIGEPQ